MADTEVAELTGGSDVPVQQGSPPSSPDDGATNRSVSPPRCNRPASPIIDIYGDGEDMFDNGGSINVRLASLSVDVNVDLKSPPSSPLNERHENFNFDVDNSSLQTTGSGVWNWFHYAKSQFDASLNTANSYLEDNPTLQATTNRIYSLGEETHRTLTQAGHNVVSSVQSYGQHLFSAVGKGKDPTPINLNIISDKHIDTASVTRAFQALFQDTKSSTYDVVSGLAAQLVGPAAAVEGCKLRIQAARSQKLVPESAVVVAVESFINEIIPGTWVEQYCMLVSDVPKQIELHVFSQPINLPTPLATKSKDATPPQYALRSSGYAKSIIEVISETFPDVNIKDWYTPFVGISNSQVLTLISNLLAALYRQRLVNMEPEHDTVQGAESEKSPSEVEEQGDEMERS